MHNQYWAHNMAFNVTFIPTWLDALTRATALGVRVNILPSRVEDILWS